MADLDFTTRGPPGADGNSFLWFRRDPTAADGRYGDTAININTTLVFIKDESGVWQPQFEMRGKRGVGGLPGPQGFGYLSGSDAPPSQLGRDGDFYVRDTASGPIIYGPKAAGQWPAPEPLVPLIIGIGPPQASTGYDGQAYLDYQNAVLYGVKANGTWPAGTTLRGLLVGAGPPNGTIGFDGQTYIDSAAIAFYGPKANGAWPATPVSLVGPTPFKPIVTWATGAAYKPGPPADLVQINGSSYACLIAHTSGTFSTDLAAGRWGLVAAKGVDGTGTGTVVPTGTVADGDLALFDGTTGNRIRSGGSLAAALAGKADKATTPTLDDFRTVAIQLAKLKGSTVGMAAGVADDFRDQSGVDTTNSLNTTFAIGGLAGTLINRVTETVESLPNMTAASAPAGSSASASGNASTAWQAFDGNTGNFWSTSGTTGWLQRTQSAPITVGAYRVFATGNGAPSGWTLSGSNDGGATLVPLDTRTAQTGWSGWRTFAIDSALVGSFTTYRLTYTGNNGDGTGTYINELEFFQAIPGPMTALSAVFPAAAQPAKGSVFVLAKALSDTITPNTNLLADISRDGGTTWTTGTLVSAGSYGGFTMYEANGFDISGQPSGTSMKWRLRTVGTALVIAVDAVVAQWG